MTQTVFIAWQDPESRSWFTIGRLQFDGENYVFCYTQGAKIASKKCNFSPLHAFPDFTQEYKSTDLFPFFTNRLIPASRPEYNDYLSWMKLTSQQSNPIEMFSRNGGRKVTDSFEIFPLPEPDKNGSHHLHFFSHGLRYLPSSSVERIHQLDVDERLYLAHDFQNPFDPKALLLCTRDRHIVGYCPRYLVADIITALQRQDQSTRLHVEVAAINPAPAPLQFRLLCKMTVKWPPNFQAFSSPEYQPLTQVKQSDKTEREITEHNFITL